MNSRSTSGGGSVDCALIFSLHPLASEDADRKADIGENFPGIRLRFLNPSQLVGRKQSKLAIKVRGIFLGVEPKQDTHLYGAKAALT